MAQGQAREIATSCAGALHARFMGRDATVSITASVGFLSLLSSFLSSLSLRSVLARQSLWQALSRHLRCIPLSFLYHPLGAHFECLLAHSLRVRAGWHVMAVKLSVTRLSSLFEQQVSLLLLLSMYTLIVHPRMRCVWRRAERWPPALVVFLSTGIGGTFPHLSFFQTNPKSLSLYSSPPLSFFLSFFFPSYTTRLCSLFHSLSPLLSSPRSAKSGPQRTSSKSHERRGVWQKTCEERHQRKWHARVSAEFTLSLCIPYTYIEKNHNLCTSYVCTHSS